MPRNSRKDLPGNFHHVMCQGINKEHIFNDDYLKEKYKSIIKKKKDENNVNIIAYCIMDNHVHLLLNVDNNEDMSKFMQQVNTIYAQFYNKVKDRVGYVFRDRYLSKSIFSELQLYRCIVYIHKNPVVAKMVKNEGKYKFSSYKEYFNLQNEKNLINNNARKIVFGTSNQNEFIEQYNYIHHYKDKDLVEFDSFERTLEVDMKELVKKYDNLSDDEKIIKIYTTEKISERNLAKIFNRTRHQIRKTLNKDNKTVKK